MACRRGRGGPGRPPLAHSLDWVTRQVDLLHIRGVNLGQLISVRSWPKILTICKNCCCETDHLFTHHTCSSYSAVACFAPRSIAGVTSNSQQLTSNLILHCKNALMGSAHNDLRHSVNALSQSALLCGKLNSAVMTRPKVGNRVTPSAVFCDMTPPQMASRR